MSYWLVTESGKVISKTSVEHVTRDDYLKPETKKLIDEFTESLTERLDDTNFQVDGAGEFQSMYLVDIEDLLNDNAGVRHEEDTTPNADEYGDMIVEERPDDDDEEAIDKYLNAELILDVGTNNERRGRVVKRSRGLDGEAIGRAHTNPLFDTREYDVEFTDGTREKYQANIIAENMFAQVDDEGYQYLILDEITDHRKDNSGISISDGMI
jgi:hypothetical protein